MGEVVNNLSVSRVLGSRSKQVDLKPLSVRKWRPQKYPSWVIKVNCTVEKASKISCGDMREDEQKEFGLQRRAWCGMERRGRGFNYLGGRRLNSQNFRRLWMRTRSKWKKYDWARRKCIECGSKFLRTKVVRATTTRRFFERTLQCNVFYPVFQYSLTGEKSDRSCALKWYIIRLIVLDSWIRTVASCLTEDDQRGRQPQKLYLHRYSPVVQLTTNRLISNIALFVKFSAVDEMVARERERNRVILVMRRCIRTAGF